MVRAHSIAVGGCIVKNSNHYEWIRVTRDDGDLRIKYKLNNAAFAGSDSHDEDVSEWSDRDIKQCVRQLLSIEDDDPVQIEIV
jgi:hypothetical protein